MENNSTSPPSQTGSNNGVLWQKIKSWLLETQAFRRLKIELPLLENESDYYQLNHPKENWLPGAKADIENIKEALKNYEPERGWKIYKKVTRQILLADFKYRHDLCLNKARGMLNESLTKIKNDSWRQKTIVDLLAVQGDTSESIKESLIKLKDNPIQIEDVLKLLKANNKDATKINFNEKAKAEDIVYAAEILDEYQDNFYYKLLIFKKRIQILTAGATLGMILWLIWTPEIGEFPYAKDIKPATIETQAEAFWQAVHARDSLLIKINQNQILAKKDTVAKNNKETADTTGNVTGSLNNDSIQTNKDTVTQGQLGLFSGAKNNENKDKYKRGTNPLRKHARMVSFWVILTGFVGSVVSGFLRSIEEGAKSTIPNQIFGTAVMWARLVLSMVSALAVYIFLSTGVIFIFQGQISFELLLTFAFVAGFTERLIKGSVEKLTKEELYSGQKGG